MKTNCRISSRSRRGWICLTLLAVAVLAGPAAATDSNQPPVIDSGIQATPNPVNNTNSASLSVSAHDPDNGPNALAYQWRLVSGPGGVTFSPNDTNLSATTTVTFSASGTYTLSVTVFDGLDSATDQINIDVTLASGTPPTISLQPTSQVLNAGETVQLTVSASGSLPLNYLWKHDGAFTGDNSAMLLIADAQAADSGQYQVTISNVYGQVVSDTVTLTVVPIAPKIATQPANQAVAVGGTATFSVTASGTEPLSYAWTHNSVVIGTDRTLTVHNAQAADAGMYFVTVTNSIGSTNSIPASLMVGSPSGNPITTNTPQVFFSAPPGSTTVMTRTLVLFNESDDPVTVNLSTPAVWLSVGPASATIAGHDSNSFLISADPNGQSGVVNTTVTATNSGGGGVLNVSVQMDLTGIHRHTANGCVVGSAPGNLLAFELLCLAALAGIHRIHHRRAPPEFGSIPATPPQEHLPPATPSRRADV